MRPAVDKLGDEDGRKTEGETKQWPARCDKKNNRATLLAGETVPSIIQLFPRNQLSLSLSLPLPLSLSLLTFKYFYLCEIFQRKFLEFSNSSYRLIEFLNVVFFAFFTFFRGKKFAGFSLEKFLPVKKISL